MGVVGRGCVIMQVTREGVSVEGGREGRGVLRGDGTIEMEGAT